MHGRGPLSDSVLVRVRVSLSAADPSHVSHSPEWVHLKKHKLLKLPWMKEAGCEHLSSPSEVYGWICGLSRFACSFFLSCRCNLRTRKAPCQPFSTPQARATTLSPDATQYREEPPLS